MYKTYKSRADHKRTIFEKFADTISEFSGSMIFLTFNVLLFTGWILVNNGYFGQNLVFDPYPYGLLTMFVSLEAIILSVILLISQNREHKITEVRDEIALQVARVAEAEITKVIELVLYSMEKNGIDVKDDKTLKTMLMPINFEKIEKSIEDEIIPPVSKIYEKIHFPAWKR